MATVASLREHLVEELNDLHNAEQQLIEALPQMAQRATSRDLKAAFKNHLAATRTHERRALGGASVVSLPGSAQPAARAGYSEGY